MREFTKQLLELLNHTGGFVTVTLTLILAILKVEGPYPATTAALTMIVLATLLWVWRWPRITHVANAPDNAKILIVGELRKQAHVDVFDPLRTRSKKLYKMQPFQRRFETSFLLFTSLFAIGFAIIQYPDIFVELGGMDCPQNVASPIRVVVADFGLPQVTAFETHLARTLGEELQGNAVCRYKRVINDSGDVHISGDNFPFVAIWGGTSINNTLIIFVDAVVDITAQPQFREDLFIPFEEKSAFMVSEVEQLPYLAKYVISELYFADGEADKAHKEIQDALIDAEKQPWKDNHPDVLANGYVLLGDISTFIGTTTSDQNELINAREAYTEALNRNPDLDIVLVNRGFIYMKLGESEKAFDDLNPLLEKNSPLLVGKKSPLAVAIYTNRGLARLDQKDYSGAIADLLAAKNFSDPENDPGVFYPLGEAYLLAGDVSSAKQTFEEAIPYLDNYYRDGFIYGLRKLREEVNSKNPDLKDEIDTIIKMLQNAGS